MRARSPEPDPAHKRDHDECYQPGEQSLWHEQSPFVALRADSKDLGSAAKGAIRYRYAVHDSDVSLDAVEPVEEMMATRTLPASSDEAVATRLAHRASRRR